MMTKWTAAVLIMIVTAGCGGSSDKAAVTTTTAVPVVGDQATPAAVDACHTAVKGLLKSPGSAKFELDEPIQSRHQGTPQQQRWNIAGTVDSENGFGALLRTVYLCFASSDNGSTFKAEVLDTQKANSIPANYLDKGR